MRGFSSTCALVSMLACSGCTFYTSCPPGASGGSSSGGGGGASNMGGSTPGGIGGTAGVGGIPSRPWSSVTANLTGLTSECGDISYVSSEPTQDKLITGVATQGLYFSTDGAKSWEPLGTGAKSDPVANRMEQVVYDPDHPSTYWQAGAYGNCAYRTDDDGANFALLGTAKHCDSISIDFSDPKRSTLLAGGHEAHVVYRSTDGGANWLDIGPNLPAEAGHTGFVYALSNTVHLVASWSAGASSGIFRTKDGGSTWTRVYSGGIDSRALLASDGALYWVTNSQENNAGVVKSSDQGLTWKKIPGSEDVMSTEQGLVELPDGRFMAPGAAYLLISADHGATWKPFGDRMPFAPWGVAYSPFQKAVYIWHFDCGSGPIVVSANAIMTMAFDWEAD